MVKKQKFSQKIRIMDKKGKFAKKSKFSSKSNFLSKIEIQSKIRNFVKIEILVNKRNFSQNSNCGLKNRNRGQKTKVFQKF